MFTTVQLQYFCDAVEISGLFAMVGAGSLFYFVLLGLVVLLSLGLGVFFFNTSVIRCGDQRLLSLIVFLLGALTFLFLIQAATGVVPLVIFSLQLTHLVIAVLFASAVAFIYSAAYETVPERLLIVLSAFVLPVIILTSSTLAVHSVRLRECAVYVGPLFWYVILFGLLSAVTVLVLAYLQRKKLKEKGGDISAVILIGGLFLFAFPAILGLEATVSLPLTTYFLPIFSGSIVVSLGVIALLREQHAALMFGREYGIVLGIGTLLVLLYQSARQYAVYIGFASLFSILLLGWFYFRSVRRERAHEIEIEKLRKRLSTVHRKVRVLDEMKSEFVSIASHQLRGPLTSIRGYASMLLEGSYGKLSKRSKEIVRRVLDASRGMTLSVEDYLNVCRLEAGGMQYTLSYFNLRDEVERIVDEMRPAALREGLLLVFRSKCSGSGLVHADVVKMRHVVQNLIDNSMKYTKKGTITVVVHDSPKKKKIWVTIQDTGVGMNEQELEGIFEKFTRLKDSKGINVNGVGLGLFVAKKVVEDMKGKLWAESVGKDKGSTFHIELGVQKGNGR